MRDREAEISRYGSVTPRETAEMVGEVQNAPNNTNIMHGQRRTFFRTSKYRTIEKCTKRATFPGMNGVVAEEAVMVSL